MSILRIHKKQNNFVILDKTCLHDRKLTLAAKGLHAYLLTLPNDWQVKVSDLITRSKNGRDSVRAILNELEEAGYIKKSVTRNDANGQFQGIEYLVLELPDVHEKPQNPRETENPSPVSPGPGNPASGIPGPANPTLINNKDNNNTRINKTAAEYSGHDENLQEQKTAAAAVLSLEHQVTEQGSQGLSANTSPIQVLSGHDALISKTLTKCQLERIQVQLDKLNVDDKQSLFDEIQFCLLSASHFSGCGRDFTKKLNAICAVIRRGGWQTPAGMALQMQNDLNSDEIKLEQALNEAKAEAIHFQRLLVNANTQAKVGFENTLKKTLSRINELEQCLTKLRA